MIWSKYEIGATYEPGSFGSSESFSSSQTFPILMASQAKKDDNGNVDWGTTYSASSIDNLRNNYTQYPYCSFNSTLDANNLYKITSATTFYYRRQKVTGWTQTGEGAGLYIGNVAGKLGDYPENGAQGGYWYILQEIT